ncbi:MAG: HU family DNA-binding protein [Myxococcaceae bacterium]
MKSSSETKNKKIIGKLDLVASISELSGLSKATSGLALTYLLVAIQKGLKEGKDVRIKGFGIFRIVKREATMGRNPRTREPIKIKASKYPKFRASKTLKDAIS